MSDFYTEFLWRGKPRVNPLTEWAVTIIKLSHEEHRCFNSVYFYLRSTMSQQGGNFTKPVSREMGGGEESDDWELWLPKCSFEEDKME